jgi:8-oxo-dGTP pyrophosphatase MutT (NUDIX family)
VNVDGIFRRLRDPATLSDADWCDGARQAAVLVALTDEPEPDVLLARRAQHLRLHAGEVAFPGGMREETDSNCWATALREAQEEAALPITAAEPLRRMAPLVTRTGIEVHPCVARIPPGLPLRHDPLELDGLFYVALARFADAANLRLDRMRYGESVRFVPRYEIGDDTIWGITAAILALVANIGLEARLDLKRDWMTNS